MPILESFRNLVERCLIIIDVIIVLPVPGMPGQNNVCLLLLSHA
jgi:hypothetical protein